MWPGPFEETLVPPSHGGSTWNLASIGSVVSEEKMFKNVDNNIRTTEAYPGSGELKMSTRRIFQENYLVALANTSFMTSIQSEPLSTFIRRYSTANPQASLCLAPLLSGRTCQSSYEPPTKWLSAQRRLRSAWASAQSDQSLRCALNG